MNHHKGPENRRTAASNVRTAPSKRRTAPSKRRTAPSPKSGLPLVITRTARSITHDCPTIQNHYSLIVTFVLLIEPFRIKEPTDQMMWNKRRMKNTLSPLHRKERLTWAETDRAAHPTQDDAKTKQRKTVKKEGVAKTSKEGYRRQKLENETRRKQGC
ncbi:hypothetical protein BLNAU_5481 [Blattamonas nauphoetae]|uniref:Uncharacterized protein n=1 Tax=Blattamonas nauphoetae TaxID=2049346 RepID=A0ABQ9Y6P1_9EUKA|nr:hypothetical protein BLNAU_5481 [Blattamonas nauphoetae]